MARDIPLLYRKLCRKGPTIKAPSSPILLVEVMDTKNADFTDKCRRAHLASGSKGRLHQKVEGQIQVLHRSGFFDMWKKVSQPSDESGSDGVSKH